MTKACHWVHGANEIDDVVGLHGEATSFCYECCEKMVAKVYDERPYTANVVGICVDGGFGIDSDYFAFCEMCSVRLQVSFTDSGFRETFDEFIKHDFVKASPDMWDMLGDLLTRLRADDVSIYEPHLDAARFVHEAERIRCWRIVAKMIRKVQRAQSGQA